MAIKTKNKFYITTAIDYVNSRPHAGHAFEKTIADAIARYKKAQGYDVFFLTGVDENAQKNVEAAQKAGIPVKEFVDRNTAFFVELCKKLNLSNSDFIRTSAKEHSIVVKKILKKIIDKRDIYKGVYKGLYCVGCEAYYTEKDLINGKCPEHNTKPELREEEAYFFKLSKYKRQLLKLIPEYVIPTSKSNEMIVRIKEELNDICISREGAKWGIDFPKDKNYKIWVWIDALINYISGLKDKEKKYWPADLHVIGKGINWFHSVIWPSILLSAGYKIPKKLLVHGYLNLGGKKLSKSLGNVIDPLELLNKYPSDVVRYSLLKCNLFDDTDYSEEILILRNNNELADKLGNLVSRVSVLIEKNGVERVNNKLIGKLNSKVIEKYLENYQLDKALSEIFTFVDVCNAYVQNKKIWETGDKKALFELKESILKIAELLWPFIPESSEKITKIFSAKNIKKAPVLFKKIVHKEDKKFEHSGGKTKGKKGDDKINKQKNIEGIMSTNAIDFSEWQKLDLRVAEIKKIEDIEGADKLYKLTLDVGELGERVICAGIKEHYKKDKLKGKKIIYLQNLKPRLMKGIESQGMLLAAVNEDHTKVVLLTPESDIENGARVS